MQTVIYAMSIVSFMSFGFWLRTHGTDNSATYRSVVYILGPIHFALSLPFYILFTIEHGFFMNWFSLVCYAIILGNIYFYFWFFRENKEEKVLDAIFEMPNITSWIAVTVFPNAFLILILGNV